MSDFSKDITRRVYHGTDRMDFGSFDIAAARPYNLGLHFGTKAAADSYCVFDDRHVAVMGEEMAKYGKGRARCAA